ncbi:DUF397 domain-containing protein [Streptomyces sp. NPDC048442]|uniref:DUF397 domain-containing protein n=1 Tax=Streptomyces sp. NPDC048442 TaxID=3154823 RepID=UPI00343B6025
MHQLNLSTGPSTLWRKSSYSSGDENDNCVEVSDCLPGVVPVRDSKVQDGPVLHFPGTSWAPFIASLKH